jgi:aminopeptidase N
MKYARSWVFWFGLVLVVSACSGTTAATTSSSTARPITTTTSSSTAPPITTTASSTTAATAPLRKIDAALVGDTGGDWTLFPDSGNGGYNVLLYDWTLVVSDDLTSLEGVVAITAEATQDLQRFSLDARDLVVDSVSVDGESVEFATVRPELIVTLDEPLTSGEEFTVTVDYAAEPALYRPEGVPFSMGWDVIPGRRVLVHGFPGAAATWTPISESLHDPARVIFRIDVPDGFTATASGFPIDDEEFFVWDTQREVSGATFSIAEYETSVVEWNGIPIEFALSSDNFKRDIWEADVPVMLDFLETVFGPFPYGRLGLSAIDGVQFALSSPMRILIPEYMPRVVLVHELAHQWAGVAVTSETEGSPWLWEGLATYTETLFREHEGQSVERLSVLLSRGVPDETRPLDQLDSIDDILDNATYQRGALLYHALRLEIGDEPFFTTIKEFIQRNLHATAEIEDLQAVAEEISGQDLSPFFTSWVSETAVPQLPPASG